MYKTGQSTYTGRARPELRCICVSDPIWNMAIELADETSTSISAFLRQLIKKAYQRSKKRLEATEAEVE